MSEMNQSRSKALLEKVYDHLDSIDVTALSMNELKDFLEVVQKGQFLEAFVEMPQCAIGKFNAPGPIAGNGETGGDSAGDIETDADK